MSSTNTRVASRSDAPNALSSDQPLPTASVDVVDLLREGRSKSRTAAHGDLGQSVVPGDPFAKEIKQPSRVAQVDDHPIPPLPVGSEPPKTDHSVGNGGVRSRPRGSDPHSAPNVEGNAPIPLKPPLNIVPTLPYHPEPLRGGSSEHIPLPPRRPDEFPRGGRSGKGETIPLPVPRPAAALNYELLNSTQPIDPHKRTIGVLDVFKRTPIVPDPDHPGTLRTNGSLMLDGPKYFITHGELTAQNAEQNGYNALRLENKSSVNTGSGFDFSKPLADIYQGVLSGKLNLKRGDIVNMSLAQNNPGLMGEPSFYEANQFLQLTNPITPGNLNSPEKRAEILDAMRTKIRDSSVDPKLRERLRQVIDTNTMIDKIQKDLGIEVVTAAGNQGPTRFSWDFLAASQRLSATDSAGQRMPWSALESSPAAKAQGSYDVRYTQDLLAPQLDPPGKYFVAGTKLSISAAQYGGPRLETPVRPTLRDMLDPPDPAASKGFTQTISYWDKPEFKLAPPDKNAHVVIAHVRSAPELTEQFLKQQREGEHVTDLNGTSFANFNWYPANRPAK